MKNPGAMALTRMPFRPVHCWAKSRVRPITPALLAEYAACGRGGVVEPRTLPMLMMLAPGFIARPQDCAIQYDPIRLVSTTRRKSSGASRLAGIAVPAPAVLTKAATAPRYA